MVKTNENIDFFILQCSVRTKNEFELTEDRTTEIWKQKYFKSLTDSSTTPFWRFLFISDS